MEVNQYERTCATFLIDEVTAARIASEPKNRVLESADFTVFGSTLKMQVYLGGCEKAKDGYSSAYLALANPEVGELWCSEVKLRMGNALTRYKNVVTFNNLQLGGVVRSCGKSDFLAHTTYIEGGAVAKGFTQLAVTAEFTRPCAAAGAAAKSAVAPERHVETKRRRRLG